MTDFIRYGTGNTFQFNGLGYRDANINTPYFNGVQAWKSGSPADQFLSIPKLQQSVNSNNNINWLQPIASTGINPITQPTVNSVTQQPITTGSTASVTQPITGSVATSTTGSVIQPTLPTGLSYRGNEFNSFDMPTLARIQINGLDNFDTSKYITNQKSWLGKETSVVDGNSMFNDLMSNPAFAKVYGAYPTQIQDGFKQGLSSGAISVQMATQNPAQALSIAQQLANQTTNNKWSVQDKLGLVQSGIGAITSLANLYMGFKQQKLAQKQLEENLRLQRANYRNQARALNAQYRDQMSGRGSTVMSGSSKRALGEMYNNRKVSETY